MSDLSTPVSKGWKTAEVKYEGFPLFLRAPSEIDYTQAAHFPVLVIITHTLDEVTSSGLPETQYNESLFDFDEEVVALFEETGDGHAVLVETFGGKRTYYLYVSSSAAIDKRFSDLRARYPEHKLSLQRNSDTDWSFRQRYAENVGF